MHAAIARMQLYTHIHTHAWRPCAPCMYSALASVLSAIRNSNNELRPERIYHIGAASYVYTQTSNAVAANMPPRKPLSHLV